MTLRRLSRHATSGTPASYTSDSQMVGHIDQGAFGQLIVSVPGVRQGWFVLVNLPVAHTDEYLLLGQHCDTDSVHVVLLNLGRASGDFDDPIRLYLVPA